MYCVLERVKLGRNRFGKYLVEFSYPIKQGIKRVYLVSTFTSMYPGRIVMGIHGGRARARVYLWDDVYPYAYVLNGIHYVLDHENPVKAEFRFWPDSDLRLVLSIAIVGLDQYSKAINEGGIHLDLVVHDEHDPSYIHRYLEYTVIRLKTVRKEFDYVEIEYIDNRGEKKRALMDRYLRDDYRDWYQILLKDDVKAYRFYLYHDRKEIVYGFHGPYSDEYIAVDHIHGVDEHRWWFGTVYYLLFPDSYGIDKPELYNKPRPRTKIGGSIKGIIERLNHIIDLGVEAVYLTPIYLAPSYHRYDVVDHREIDPVLGSIGDFKELVDVLHRNGIKVVLDLIVHHLSVCSKEFRDILEKGSRSIYWKWFKVLVDDISEVDRETIDILRDFIEKNCVNHINRALPSVFYESFLSVWKLARLDHSYNDVVKYIEEVMEYWIKLGVDGYRVDVGHALPDNVMERLYRFLKSINRDAVLIYEISIGVKHYPIGIYMDSAMNYDLRSLLLEFVVYRSIDANKFSSKVKELYLSMPLYAMNSLYNLLSSHDTPRIRTIVEEHCSNPRKCLEILYVLLFMLPGSPSIYYGDEIGLKGGRDPECRGVMVWSRDLWDTHLLKLIKSLIDLRKRYHCLRYGFFDIYPVNAMSITIRRWYRECEVVAIVSLEDTVCIDFRGKGYVDPINGTGLESLCIDPMDWRILVKQ